MYYFLCTIMNWNNLLEKLMRDFRISETEMASISGLTQPTINRIRKGFTLTPNQNTIKRLEEGLKIKIDDHDPENLTYRLIGEVKEPTPDYGLPEPTKEDLELLSKLKEMGIDSVEKLEKFYNLEGIAEDIKEVLRKRLEHN